MNAINSPESVGRTLKPHRKGVSNYAAVAFNIPAHIGECPA